MLPANFYLHLNGTNLVKSSSGRLLSADRNEVETNSLMLTIDSLIAVLSLCLTSFGLGVAMPVVRPQKITACPRLFFFCFCSCRIAFKYI